MSKLAEPVSPSIAQRPHRRTEIPALENGDHLSLEEFERRYNAMPAEVRAELIEGRVFMAPAVSLNGHGTPHFYFTGALCSYALATPGVLGSNDSSIRLDIRNMPQPDVFLYIHPSCGGQAKVADDDYLAGAPEFVAEIAATPATYDLHEKLAVYARHGVREYLVWRTYDNAVDYFTLGNGGYTRLDMTEGVYRSRVLPGLWLRPEAIIEWNWPVVLQTIQQGVASPEHADFLSKLQAAQKPPQTK
jgi:hypothetical protein